MRNSDVQASIYWLARMLEAGEDPLYVARRIVRFASEDIGMADSRALEICVAAYQACHYLGMPECNVHLTHAVTYCALAPKSNSLEVAYLSAKEDAIKTLQEPVPLQIRNAPTKLMKELNYGKDYEYSHDYKYHMTDMVCMPDGLIDRQYYKPSDQGSEVKVKIVWTISMRSRRNLERAGERNENCDTFIKRYAGICPKMANLCKDKQIVITLDGDLGAGKTTWTKSFGKALGVKDVINSPTFTILKSYTMENGKPLHHIDAYRLEGVSQDLGFEECFDEGISVVEWADFIKEQLPKDHISISIEEGIDEERMITMVSTGPLSSSILEGYHD